ncbi:hypothetical protein RRF57_001762 [Xylaria bambusicola]|uniref:Uncharacterized protein n=1 Tax=Xylaria bambusicola TaxID=326684 RepID=A0AAN7Z6F3_9PEZI
MASFCHRNNMDHFKVMDLECFGSTHPPFDEEVRIPRHEAAQAIQRRHLLRNNPNNYAETKEAEEPAGDCDSARKAFEERRAPAWLYEPLPLSTKHQDCYYSDENRWNWYYKDENRDVQYTRDIAATQFVYDESTIDIFNPWINLPHREAKFRELEPLFEEDGGSETPRSKVTSSSWCHMKLPTKSKLSKSPWFSKAKNIWKSIMDYYANYVTLHQYKYSSVPRRCPSPPTERPHHGRRCNPYQRGRERNRGSNYMISTRRVRVGTRW